ncbi:hypothetical protein KAU59_01275, partial [candidate division WOR-3 bacterium]|nr:hypothetical protein [candidate division WOR-3 bacterium]
MKNLCFILFTVLFLLPCLTHAGWIEQNSGIINELWSVHFPADAQTGYAVGGYGKILKTTDGGANWVS